MKKEDLKTGQELQDRIKKIDADIEIIRSDGEELPDAQIHRIEIIVVGSVKGLGFKREYKTEKENTEMNMNYLDKLIMECFTKTLKKRKEELENEFELLGK